MQITPGSAYGLHVDCIGTRTAYGLHRLQEFALYVHACTGFKIGSWLHKVLANSSRERMARHSYDTTVTSNHHHMASALQALGPCHAMDAVTMAAEAAAATAVAAMLWPIVWRRRDATRFLKRGWVNLHRCCRKGR